MAFTMEDLRDPADDTSFLRKGFRERRYRERAAVCFGHPDFRQAQALPFEEAMAALENVLDAGAITPEEFEEARRVDAVIRGRRAQGWLHLALEISWVVDRGDVERAVKRAKIRAKALGKTRPAVAGRELTEGAREAIERLHQEGRPTVAVQDEEAVWPPEPQGAIHD
ncbi:hypothetical protein [Thermoflexus hugenholtzii]